METCFVYPFFLQIFREIISPRMWFYNFSKLSEQDYMWKTDFIDIWRYNTWGYIYVEILVDTC